MEYVKGARYRVIREGAYLVGMQPVGRGVRQGWKQTLAVGTVLTHGGRSMTSGDGVPIDKWLDEDGKWMADDCQLLPSAPGCTIWTERPDPSLLEPVA